MNLLSYSEAAYLSPFVSHYVVVFSIGSTPQVLDAHKVRIEH